MISLAEMKMVLGVVGLSHPLIDKLNNGYSLMSHFRKEKVVSLS